MEMTQDDAAALKQPDGPRFSNALTPAQLRAAAKVVNERRAHEVRRLRRVLLPPEQLERPPQAA